MREGRTLGGKHIRIRSKYAMWHADDRSRQTRASPVLSTPMFVGVNSNGCSQILDGEQGHTISIWAKVTCAQAPHRVTTGPHAGSTNTLVETNITLFTDTACTEPLDDIRTCVFWGPHGENNHRNQPRLIMALAVNGLSRTHLQRDLLKFKGIFAMTLGIPAADINEFSVMPSEQAHQLGIRGDSVGITVSFTPSSGSKLRQITTNIATASFHATLTNNVKSNFPSVKFRLVRVQQRGSGGRLTTVCNDKCLKKANAPKKNDSSKVMWIVFIVVGALLFIAIVYAYFTCGDQGKYEKSREYRAFGETGEYRAPGMAPHRRNSDVGSEMAYGIGQQDQGHHGLRHPNQGISQGLLHDRDAKVVM